MARNIFFKVNEKLSSDISIMTLFVIWSDDFEDTSL